mmetsp:Transcript_19110/g.53092  ORF Transcript_19110/g.53092 Transcript_19110/m.53092 type:complete len:130 (+) Transcript_19110:268-657(+)
MKSYASILLLVLVTFLTNPASAFVTPNAVRHTVAVQPRSASALNERQWNFNEGRSPWGLKKNAETWNGRVAQVAFVWVFLQELILNKGIVDGLRDGDTIFVVNAGLFAFGVVALTAWLAIQGEDDYTKA